MMTCHEYSASKPPLLEYLSTHPHFQHSLIVIRTIYFKGLLITSNKIIYWRIKYVAIPESMFWFFLTLRNSSNFMTVYSIRNMIIPTWNLLVQKLKTLSESSLINLVIVVLSSVKPSPSQFLFKVSIPSSSESMYGMRVSLDKYPQALEFMQPDEDHSVQFHS